jgi:aspartate aminotransferase
MPALADRMKTAKPSTIIQMAEKVKALKKQGKDIVSFSIGVPNFLPAKHIYDAAHAAIDHDKGDYLPGRGSEELVAAFCTYMTSIGLPYGPTEVAASIGGKHGLFNVFMAMLNAGDEVLIPTPYWTSYADMIDFVGGKPVFLPCPASQNYKLTPAQLEKAIGPKTKMFLFNNPSNPTGMVYTKAEIAALGAVLEKHDLWIVSDDIYDRMIFDGEKFHSLLHTNPKLRDRTAIIQSISKNYGMPGWRGGMVAGPEGLIKALLAVNSNSITNIPGVVMSAAAAAWAGPQDFSDEMAKKFQVKRDMVMKALLGIPGVTCPKPGGAFYAFPDVSAYFGKTFKGTKIDTDVTLCNLMLEHAGVACVPGSAFGDKNGLRISYALPDAELAEGLRRFVKFFADVAAESSHAA